MRQMATKHSIHVEKGNPASQIKKVIAVMSGKGGVGKTSVASLLAVSLHKKGYKVGILDADITGPSVPKAFGLNEAKATAAGENNDIKPVYTASGMPLMSINFLLPDSTDPVIWRGPLISNVIKQFWNNVVWGELDYLVIDMPPGTGDVPLTVFQSLPVDGVVVVTAPQDLVTIIVRKAVKMAQMMRKPILGLVENMAYFICPDCGKRHNIWGESHLAEVAANYEIKNTVQLPLEPRFASACDGAGIESVQMVLPDEFIDNLLSSLQK